MKVILVVRVCLSISDGVLDKPGHNFDQVCLICFCNALHIFGGLGCFLNRAFQKAII